MIYEYSGSVTSDLECIKFFLDEILVQMENYIKDQETIFDLRLILNELVLNGAIHGNKLSKSKEVSLEISLKNGVMQISVEDEGDGIECSINEYDPSEMKCCGRGLIIVDRLSDKLLIEKNKIRVVKNLV